MMDDLYTWDDWEPETNLMNDDDREGVYFITIWKADDEFAVIIHRVSDTFPLDGPVAKQKQKNAQAICDALNRS